VLCCAVLCRFAWFSAGLRATVVAVESSFRPPPNSPEKPRPIWNPKHNPSLSMYATYVCCPEYEGIVSRVCDASFDAATILACRDPFPA